MNNSSKLVDDPSHFILRGSLPGESLEFLVLPKISERTFNITASFRGYKVEETSVTLLNGPMFIEQLVAFEKRREGTAKLNGTYDFELEVGSFEHRGAALVSFSVSSLLLLPNKKYGRCRLDAAFVVEGEYIAALLKGMRSLFR